MNVLNIWSEVINEEMVEKSQYNSLAEWKKADYNNYRMAYHNGWLDKVCEYFGWDKIKSKKPPKYWTKKNGLIN